MDWKYIPTSLVIEKATKIICKIRTIIPVNEWSNVLLLGDFNLNLNMTDKDDLRNYTYVSKWV